MKTLPIYITFLLFLGNAFLSAQNKELIQAMKKEVDRNKNELRIGAFSSPFFIGYTIVETNSIDVIAALGGIVESDQRKSRTGFSNLLVGNYQRNNHNPGNNMMFPMGFGPQQEIPLNNSPEGVARAIWRDLDIKYKGETEKLEAKMNFLRQHPLSAEEESLPDFEQTVPVQLYLKSNNIKLDKEYWENFAKKASAVFRKYASANHYYVSVTARDAVHYYYNTEGTETIVPYPYYKIHIHASSTTHEGHNVGDDFYYEFSEFEDMPDLKTVQDKCIEIAAYIEEVKKAPAINEAYRGPVLIEEMALAEIFQHTFFANNEVLMAKRKSDYPQRDGNPNEVMHDRRVISRNLSVIAMSGTETYNGKRLDGYYPVDAQGVKPAKEITLIENGILKNMLTDRTPTPKYSSSNGHSRLGLRYGEAKVLPGNARLSSNETCSSGELKNKLMQTVKEEGLSYGYIIRRIRGNQPLAIYRIYIDGREERVRDATIAGLQMRSFDRILGASDKEFFHNTYWFGVFTTYIVPESMLFEEMEITPHRQPNRNPNYVIPAPQ